MLPWQTHETLGSKQSLIRSIYKCVTNNGIELAFLIYLINVAVQHVAQFFIKYFTMDVVWLLCIL